MKFVIGDRYSRKQRSHLKIYDIGGFREEQRVDPRIPNQRYPLLSPETIYIY